MSTRMRLWNAETDADDELAEVDLNLAIGSYGQSGIYDEGSLLGRLRCAMVD